MSALFFLISETLSPAFYLSFFKLVSPRFLIIMGLLRDFACKDAVALLEIAPRFYCPCVFCRKAPCLRAFPYWYAASLLFVCDALRDYFLNLMKG